MLPHHASHTSLHPCGSARLWAKARLEFAYNDNRSDEWQIFSFLGGSGTVLSAASLALLLLLAAVR